MIHGNIYIYDYTQSFMIGLNDIYNKHEIIRNFILRCYIHIFSVSYSLHLRAGPRARLQCKVTGVVTLSPTGSAP